MFSPKSLRRKLICLGFAQDLSWCSGEKTKVKRVNPSRIGGCGKFWRPCLNCWSKKDLAQDMEKPVRSSRDSVP